MSNTVASSTTTVVGFGLGTPAEIGGATTDKVGFYGNTAVVQAAAPVAVGTSIPVAACATFGLTSTQLTAIVTAVNALITALGATSGVGLTG